MWVHALADSDEINPAIVIEIDRSDSRSTLPIQIRQRNPLKAFAFFIAPQTDSRRTGMSESKVHPAVLIEIEGHHTHWRRQTLFREINSGKRFECTFARIKQNGCALRASC